MLGCWAGAPQSPPSPCPLQPCWTKAPSEGGLGSGPWTCTPPRSRESSAVPATSPPSPRLPSRLMRALMKISGGPLLSSTPSKGGMLGARGLRVHGQDPHWWGAVGCPRLPSEHRQMGAESLWVGERVGFNVPAGEKNIFTVVGGSVCVHQAAQHREQPVGLPCTPCPTSQPHRTSLAMTSPPHHLQEMKPPL